MKRSLFLLLAATFMAKPSFSYPLQGQMDSGYALPYLWDSYPGYSNPNWMAGVDDDKSLAEISIPGTHNSLSTEGNLYSITQTLDTTAQLNMGIRYFDVRFKYKNGVLKAFHGDYEQPSTFDEFMDKVSTFLYAYPSETVLIRIQNEAGASKNEKEFFNSFQIISNKYNDQKIIPSSITPRLGDVRGKFIFIRDFNIFGGSIGLDRRNFLIQDIYTVQTNWDLYRKWEDVKSHFNSIKHNNGRNISLNYLSGSNIAFPYFVASGKSSSGSHDPQLWTGVSTVDKSKYPDFPRRDCLGSLCSIYFSGTNQLTNAWIKNGKLSGNLGVVVMDFPGGELVDNIIQTNNSKFIIFEHINNQGSFLEIDSDINFLQEMNDRMSSWVIPRGWEVRFYEHADFQGKYYTRTHNGNASDFNDSISSIKILRRQ
ncbi:phosphatidylinositol-specific phospholipase C domain-containing protein [Vibrio cholerae]|uniref:phosphatidylinositol-specific phospholipase C domain-containing protein n=2 Tax=Vibrio cholerae TaxID=666 RepID=UPI000A49725E|nr:phosphatidylinositol-specific phospholipase C domain-containing protein [Vibrio cholerae]NOE71858.1 phosphatidylinositol-specific phospholipase C domain-containing protein [Vibrio cholerae]NOE87894.1 phosphatidylinositol-specific phospholipase C domain-containing protein [Vibrio cholerae]NOE94273.1 phosphatidylinositol-specific phospholipase C domain-containing protein [Vibrio cholerae]